MHTTPLDYWKSETSAWERDTGNALEDMQHTCASKNTYVEILLCLYRECFAMIKKWHFRQLTRKIRVGKRFSLFYNFFSVLIVIVDACLSRWKDVCLSFGTRSENCCCGQSGPMIQIWCQKALCWVFCYWDRLGSLYCVGMSACCRPFSILSVACALAPTWLLKHLFTTWD